MANPKPTKSAKFGVEFGALAPKLHEQFPIDRRKLRYLQVCADGITALAVGRLLTDAEVRRARQRLVKRLAQTFGRHLTADGRKDE